jgi:mono/diheme cytochrome c family protein
MKRISSFKLRLRAGAGLAVVAGTLYVASIALVGGADAKADKAAKPEKTAQSEKQTPKKAQKKKLTGAELYAVHCGRCHPERYPTEFTAAQWKTIVAEMQVRANLPAVQAKAILKYLQEDSGTP